MTPEEAWETIFGRKAVGIAVLFLLISLAFMLSGSVANAAPLWIIIGLWFLSAVVYYIRRWQRMSEEDQPYQEFRD